METRTLQVNPEDTGTRLDAWLAGQLPDVTRSAAARLCEEGRVTAAGKPLAKNYRLGGGEAAVSGGGPSHLEEKPPLPLAHPKADVAGIVLGEHLEHAAVGLEKGKVAQLFHGERDAVDGLLCHTCLLKDGEDRCTAALRWVVGRAGFCIQPPLHSSTCCL